MFGNNAAGEPDYMVVDVEASHDEISAGDHYEMAKDMIDEDFKVYLVADEDDPLYRQVVGKPVEEVLEDLENGLDDNNHSIVRLEEQQRTLDRTLHALTLHGRKSLHLSSGNMAFLVVCLVIIGVVPWVLAKAAFTPQRPVVRVAAPTITVDAAEISDALVTDAVGFDPNTSRIYRMPEPASDPEEFETTCTDICRVQGERTARFNSLGRNAQELPSWRTLVNDSEHRICTCFDGIRIHRYVDWRIVPR